MHDDSNNLHVPVLSMHHLASIPLCASDRRRLCGAGRGVEVIVALCTSSFTLSSSASTVRPERSQISLHTTICLATSLGSTGMRSTNATSRSQHAPLPTPKPARVIPVVTEARKRVPSRLQLQLRHFALQTQASLPRRGNAAG